MTANENRPTIIVYLQEQNRYTLMEVFQPRTEDSPVQPSTVAIQQAQFRTYDRTYLPQFSRLRCQPTALAHEKSSSQCHRPEKATLKGRRRPANGNSAWCQAILPLRHIRHHTLFSTRNNLPRSFAISYFPSPVLSSPAVPPSSIPFLGHPKECTNGPEPRP